jgi:enoyl-CoA hydratase/carnithine racemase
MKKSRKGEYLYQEHCGHIIFDFSQERSLHISEFFHNCSLHLKKLHRNGARVLILHIKGFSTEQHPESLRDSKNRDSFQRGLELLDQILSLKIPLISSITGHVGGPLLEPVLFSDFLFAAPGTKISSLFIDKGYFSRMGMLSKLSEILGRGNLPLFLMNGLDLTPDARRIFPLLYQVTHDNEKALDDFIEELLKKADYPMRLIKELSHHGKTLPPRKAYMMERYNFALCFSDHQFKEKIESFFKKRA